MKLSNFILGIAAALCSLAPVSWAQGNKPVERIFYNGKIFTAEPEHPYAEAVAIRGDKIVAVGSRGEVTTAVGAGAENIDLHGKTMLPGLIDNHIHAIDGGG